MAASPPKMKERVDRLAQKDDVMLWFAEAPLGDVMPLIEGILLEYPELLPEILFGCANFTDNAESELDAVGKRGFKQAASLFNKYRRQLTRMAAELLRGHKDAIDKYLEAAVGDVDRRDPPPRTAARSRAFLEGTDDDDDDGDDC